jgi:hypothetical protein
MNALAAVVILTGVIALAAIAAVAANMDPTDPTETIVAGPGTRFETRAANGTGEAPSARVPSDDGATRVQGPLLDVKFQEGANDR